MALALIGAPSIIYATARHDRGRPQRRSRSNALARHPRECASSVQAKPFCVMFRCSPSRETAIIVGSDRPIGIYELRSEASDAKQKEAPYIIHPLEYHSRQCSCRLERRMRSRDIIRAISVERILAREIKRFYRTDFNFRAPARHSPLAINTRALIENNRNGRTKRDNGGRLTRRSFDQHLASSQRNPSWLRANAAAFVMSIYSQAVSDYVIKQILFKRMRLARIRTREAR